MANGTESPNYRDCSEIRPGMKREFAMMMNQSQFMGPIGRTRSSRSSTGPITPNPTLKKPKTSAKANKIGLDGDKLAKNEAASEEEEQRSGIVDIMSDDDNKLNENKAVDDNGGKIVNLDDLKSPDTVDCGGEIVCENSNSYSLRRITRSVSKSGLRDEEVKEEIGESNVVVGEEMKVAMPVKNVAEMKTAMKLKDLLETGFLEGLPVKYMRSAKVYVYLYNVM